MKRLLITFLSTLGYLCVLMPPAHACLGLNCEEPDVGLSDGSLKASFAWQTPAGAWFASNQAPAAHPYTYALTRPCIADDRDTGTCRPSDFIDCPVSPGRVVEDL